MLVSSSPSASGEDVHVFIVQYCPVLGHGLLQQMSVSHVWKQKSHCSSCLCLIYSALWRWVKQSVAAYRKPGRRSQKLHAEQRLFTCLREPHVADERDHQVSQKDKLICSSPQSGWRSWKRFWSLTCVLCLSSFLPGFGCIHSYGEEAQIIFSLILSDGA